MPVRTFEAQVVEGCLVKTTNQLRPKASAIIRDLVARLKACGYEAVPFEKGRFRGRCHFHFNDSKCEIFIQETISRYRADGTQGPFRPTGHLYLRARVDRRNCIYRVNWAGRALEDQLDDIISELGRYTQKKDMRQTPRPAREVPMPELDREKIRNAVRGLQDQSVYYMLCDAIDLLPDAELAKLIAPYIHLERLRADGQRKPGLLEDVKAFESASLAGEYYESFDVNSKNCTALSKGTCAWICRCRRLLDRCIAESESGDRAQALAAFETIFGLLRRIDAGEDIIFFADEGGSWQVGVDWPKVFPAWFACLAASTAPDEYARRIAATVDEFDRANREKHQAAARRVAPSAQPRALDGP